MQANYLVHDLIGIGFGPSNLALAIALREAAPADGALDACFIEQKSDFVWHGDMLLDDSRMQISFLKDLVTLRNPASPYTFINYLQQHGRLQDFINLKTFYPSRHEFNDYLRWAAGRFAADCHYGEEVVAVEPVLCGGVLDHLCVRSRLHGGAERLRHARNVVLSVGGAPHIPPLFAAWRDDARVFHSSRYLAGLAALPQPCRVAVVGAGQSAAEIFLDLQARGPGMQVDLIARNAVLRPADDSAFVNQIFNPEYTDYVYQRSSDARRSLIDDLSNTNYAVVDTGLIERIYDLLYQQKVRGSERHRVLFEHEVASLRSGDDGALLAELRHGDGGPSSARRYDAVVLATGYQRQTHRRLLAPLAQWFDAGDVARDYRLRGPEDCAAGIFLQGCCEDTHGLSDTLLSVLAIRSQEIADAMLEQRRQWGRPAAGADSGSRSRRESAHAC
ncbi:lysine N(6)-hydroxylase/L-ornithine N(5)-oxygenase family protein [Janthinobacterium sp.]|uniref:lysine N(6)-hydroxylase/L-ornithine N(5)-oxygenase family protein n=1 Tax=Janthinobacterium sp. TaxID=1871054 RepID=UPI002589A53E|nr:lysine N(6)-hydroxylase/L-ornithine N(5)-oxygenase family protein [Janthinobacterium sp.]MCX7289795.1 lysine N(6)-hydroxylase/L-ornithine N(5)-oxygenase family protein [Janthinobacterium sp.]